LALPVIEERPNRTQLAAPWTAWNGAFVQVVVVIVSKNNAPITSLSGETCFSPCASLALFQGALAQARGSG